MATRTTKTQSFSSNLFEARTALGLRQLDVAKIVGLSGRSYFSELENGTRTTTSPELVAKLQTFINTARTLVNF